MYQNFPTVQGLKGNENRIGEKKFKKSRICVKGMQRRRTQESRQRSPAQVALTGVALFCKLKGCLRERAAW